MENNRFLGSISSSSFKNFFPRSASSRPKTTMKSTPTMLNPNSENLPPVDPNIQVSDPSLSPSKKTPSKSSMIHQETCTSVAKLDVSALQNPPVKVMVRIRPSQSVKTGDCIVKKVSEDSVSVEDRKFSLDSVFDASSTQDDLFQNVGVPLVNDALSGYNTSILTYGQTGSGKTYTMWGPPSAMVEGTSAIGDQGIVPRIFEMLFTKIQQDKDNSEGRQINYQCRCSFFEIYNGQIGDLLDATQRNLEIKEDAKYGVFVENLTEEYVTSYEDVTQMLIKGLSSRKVGTTSTNTKSSRSHIVFTCMIESWCKETSSKCFGSSKTSRINLVDLAGFEKNILEGVSKQSLKEGKFVKKSTSQLGNLINILANNTTHLETSEGTPYGKSILTKFLKESFGGNAKLSVICTVFPDNKFSNETTSTLRFGKQIKLVQNKPVINEITEDDVNDLSDQIRQLKEELLRAKSSSVSNSTETCPTYSNTRTSVHVRESLNQLRLGLNRSLILPNINDDSHVDDVVHSTEDDFKELGLQLSSYDGDSEDDDGEEFFVASEKYVSCSDESETDEPKLRISSVYINSRRESEVFQEPILSESPKIMNNSNRKSLAIISEQYDAPEISKSVTQQLPKLDDEPVMDSIKHTEYVRSSLRSSKILPGPTDSLAASLHRGLQIIEYHKQQNSSLDRSCVSFSFEHLAVKQSSTEVENVNAMEKQQSSALASTFVCQNCQKIESPDEAKNLDADTTSTQLTKRETELENVVKEQEAEIEKLNQQLKKYKVKEYQNSSPTLLLENGIETRDLEVIKEECEEIHMIQSIDGNERKNLLKEIASLRSKLTVQTEKSTDRIRSSLLAQSIQLRKSGVFARSNSIEDIEKERERWTEMESEWICLTDELRMDLESERDRAEKAELELRLEKKSTEELDDVLKRSILGHARMVEHYADLQEKYNDLAERHRLVQEGVADLKRAVAKVGAKKKGGCHGSSSRFYKSLANELSNLRFEKKREFDLMRKENASLKCQLRDTAEAVHAAGELLVRLKEAEETASVSEQNISKMQEENEKLKKQIEKLRRKHKMEMITMKQYLGESRLPESALRGLQREDSLVEERTGNDEDQAWKAEFGAIYQEQEY